MQEKRRKGSNPHHKAMLSSHAKILVIIILTSFLSWRVSLSFYECNVSSSPYLLFLSLSLFQFNSNLKFFYFLCSGPLSK